MVRYSRVILLGTTTTTTRFGVLSAYRHGRLEPDEYGDDNGEADSLPDER